MEEFRLAPIDGLGGVGGPSEWLEIFGERDPIRLVPD